MRCILGHKWHWFAKQYVDIYGDGFGNRTAIPTSTKTELSGQCERCGKAKVKRIRGRWQGAL